MGDYMTLRQLSDALRDAMQCGAMWVFIEVQGESLKASPAFFMADGPKMTLRYQQTVDGVLADILLPIMAVNQRNMPEESLLYIGSALTMGDAVDPQYRVAGLKVSGNVATIVAE